MTISVDSRSSCGRLRAVPTGLRKPPSVSQSPVPYCLLPIAYCLLLIAYCLLPAAFCLKNKKNPAPGRGVYKIFVDFGFGLCYNMAPTAGILPTRGLPCLRLHYSTFAFKNQAPILNLSTHPGVSTLGKGMRNGAKTSQSPAPNT